MKELQILAKDLDCKTIKVDSLTAGFVHAMSLLLDLLILENAELLDAEHLFAEALNGQKLVIWLGHLDFVEYL